MGRAIKLAATSSNNTISQENEDVKSFNENSSEKFSRKEVKQDERGSSGKTQFSLK